MLNAFRHHRGSHSSAAASALHVEVCSTPFGITEVLTGQQTQDAQFSRRCSTPFGITEVLTQSGRSSCLRPLVLNAFRHHRGSHRSSPGTRQRSRRCAQRLSASQRFSLAPAGGVTVPVSMCAQRLSASQRFSQKLPRDPPAQPKVCSTPFGITEVLTRSSRRRDRPRVYVCSTPFGITEVLTQEWRRLAGRHPLGAQRLSASQRFSHRHCQETD